METSELIKRILAARGIEGQAAMQRFLYPEYEHLHNPMQLAGMKEAVARIVQAIKAQEQIVIYGDYDIDGLSATALLLDALSSMGADVSAYIPDRFEEGYGINTAALKKLHRQGADLVITVDCGSISHKPLAWAKEAGLDVVVTDHHTVGDTLPEAIAVINPKRADNEYPFTDLAGVGVAFKLVQGLQASTDLLPAGQEKWLLDLVALGTVCDVVGLVDENRVLVTYGLKVFAKTRRVGLAALMAVADIDPAGISPYHFGFMLGPRLNAAGRLEHAKLSLELFTTSDRSRAIEIATRLDELNAERRRQQDEILEGALAQAEEFRDDPVLVLSHPDWNHGIVGIVAAKIMERFNKPTIVMQEMGDLAKGSARSLSEFSMVAAMRSVDALLTKYGGHHVAAGCALEVANIPAFRAALNDYFKNQGFGDLTPKLEADIDLDTLEPLDWALYHELEQLAPFGMGNPRPLFRLPDADISRRRAVGADGRHLKVTLHDGSRSLDGIGFGQVKAVESLGERADVYFELDQNEFRGSKSLQAMIKELGPCTS